MADNLADLWQYIDQNFQEKFSNFSYKAWIATAKPVAIRNNQLIISVPTQLHKDYWERQLMVPVVELVYQYTQKELTPIIQVAQSSDDNPETARFGNPEETEEVEKDEKNPDYLRETHLNDKYTFDTFVIGTGNQMAHAAALVVSEQPGQTYNPLFLYGGVGLGKTHLMQAIGHQLLKNDPHAKVKYVTSEAFVNDYITSIQTHRMEQFRLEYRTCDLLMVDDIQFFAEKEGAQEEFFHTFNELYNNHKQIVLTSDRLPNDIPKLQERLVSRFKWGLSVDITPPDLETRTAILRNKANAEQLDIPDDTLGYIAAQIDSNVRELEGALVRVQAFAQMKKTPVTTSLAADALKGLKATATEEIPISRIQRIVARYYHVTVQELQGKKRVKAIVNPRQIAMYLARELTDNSLPKIGQEFGGRDHTTVIHGYDKIAGELKDDPALRDSLNELKSMIREQDGDN